MNLKKKIQKYKLVFWDFDGTIKESLEVKSSSFEKLFSKFGDEIAKKVRTHHEENGGVSRFRKIPLYLKWSGVEASKKKIEIYCKMFSDLVVEKITLCPWVEGVYDYINDNHNNQMFVLITATPIDEIKLILRQMDFDKQFKYIFGSPIDKSRVVLNTMLKLNAKKEETLLIGDSIEDLNAAKNNGIDFILRETPYNKKLGDKYSYPSFKILC